MAKVQQSDQPSWADKLGFYFFLGTMILAVVGGLIYGLMAVIRH